jgi:pimeloyl-ACP methyl ester carboxylesterase
MPDALSLGHHLMVCGAPRPAATVERIVLLHGWLQSSEVWVTTASHLAQMYGANILLLDWFGHGRSHASCPSEQLRVDALEEQLTRVLAHYGWDTGQPLVFAGISLGGGIALRYFDRNPQRVGRMLLVCSAGLNEKWWAVPSLTKPLRKAILCTQAIWKEPPFLRWIYAHLRLISSTPTYGVAKDIPERLAQRGVPLALVWGSLDMIHSAQIERWRGGRSPKDVPARVIPLCGHVQLCSRIDDLALWNDAELWSTILTALPSSKL